MTDELYDEMAKDPIMSTVLDLGPDGPSGLDYCPMLERLSDGVLRIGHSEETTDCCWRVPDPAVLLGGAAGAPTDARRELLGILAKELTAAQHKLQSLAFDHPNTPHAYRVRSRETHLHKAIEGVKNALRVVEAARMAKPSTRTSASSSAATHGASAAACVTATSTDPQSGLPFYVVGGKSTWDHPTRPVVASVLAAIRAVSSLRDHELVLRNSVEPNSDDSDDGCGEQHPDDASDVIDPDGEFDEETKRQMREDQRHDREAENNEPYRLLDPAFDTYPKVLDDDGDDYRYGAGSYDFGLVGFRPTGRTRRQEALRCKVGDYVGDYGFHSRNKRRRYGYDHYALDEDRECNCADAALNAAYSAGAYLKKIAEMLHLPPAMRPVPQFMYTTAYMQPYPALADEATDDDVLNATTSVAHEADLRAFLRHAAASGHEVLIHHNVG